MTEIKKEPRVLVVGDVILDRYFGGKAERLSPEAPVPVLRHIDTVCMAGGAANVACNVVSMGGRAHLIGLIGDDAEGAILTELVSNAGVRVDAELRENWPTIVKTRLSSGGHQIARIDREEIRAPSRALSERLKARFLNALEQCDIVVVSDYAKGCITRDFVAFIVARAHERGKEIVVDPKNADFSFYEGADVLTPNLAEMERFCASALTSEAEINVALERAALKTGGAILLTRAHEGASWRKNDETTRFRTEKIAVSDVSGAGDTLVATLAVFRAEGKSWENAITQAIRAATLSVARAGVVQIKRSELESDLTSLQGAILDMRRVDFARALDLLRETWNGEKIVFANGCFDLLHQGHLKLLNRARRLGDRLVVGLNTDSSVKTNKGDGRPVNDENTRALILASMRTVDAVILFDEKTPLTLIKALEPDILVKGADYEIKDIVGAKEVSERGGEVVRITLEEGFSTSALIEKIRNAQ